MKSFTFFIALMIVLISISCNNQNNTTKNDSNNVISDKEKIEINIPSDSTNNIVFNDSENYKCNIDIVLETHENIDSLSVEKIIFFLRVFSKECRNNIEFLQFSNEVLFEILDKQPANFITAFCQENKAIEYAEIYRELESPINDLIPIEKIKKSITLYSDNCSRTDSLIKYISIAAEKY